MNHNKKRRSQVSINLSDVWNSKSEYQAASIIAASLYSPKAYIHQHKLQKCLARKFRALRIGSIRSLAWLIIAQKQSASE